MSVSFDEQEAWNAYTEFVTQQGERLREAYGIDFGDPEMEMIVTDGTEENYYESIRQAAEARVERVQGGSAESTDEEQEALRAYADYITEQGDRLREAYGLSYDDPELAAIATGGDEAQYFKSIKQAAQAKQERLAQEPAGEADELGVGAAVHEGFADLREKVATIATRSAAKPAPSTANVTDSEELYAAAGKKFKADLAAANAAAPKTASYAPTASTTNDPDDLYTIAGLRAKEQREQAAQNG